MKRNEILAVFARNEQSLRDMGVKSLSIFGSIARDEATESSDVDCLVEFDRSIGMFHFIRVQQYLEELIGRKVDLVTMGGLRPQFRDRILREKVHAL